MNVDTARLPDYVEKGARGGPTFDTTVLTSVSGVEQRVINRLGRCQYSVGYGLRTKAQWAPVLAFHYAQRGQAYGFTFKDWSDFTSNDNEQIGVGDGASTDFQLIKIYNTGSRSYTRNITLPDASSLTIVKVNGVSAGFSLPGDGIVRMASPPVNGALITVPAYNFFVPVRFAADALEIDMQLAIAGAELAQIAAIMLIEISAASPA